MTQAIWKRHAGEFAWITLLLLAFVVASHVAVWVVTLQGVVPLWAGAILQTFVAYLAFTVAHEAAHGNICGKKRHFKPLNDLAGWMSSVLLFAPYPAFRVLHLQHHSHVNESGADPDHWVASSSVVGVVARCWTILPHYYYSLLVGESSRTNSGRKVRAISLATLAGFLVVFALATISGYGLEVLFLWFVPAYVASGILAFAFDWLPHHPHDNQERFHDTRVILGPGLPLVTMWQSYHLVHHLYPRVPFYRYGLCFDDIRPDLEERGCRIDNALAFESRVTE